MARLAAIPRLGESITALLRMRRDLAAQANNLAPVPASIEITQTSIAKLASGQLPTTGLGLLCFDMIRSEHSAPIRRSPTESPRPEIALELLYLLIAWSAKPEEEQAALAWAMLELDAHAVLDASILRGGSDVWEAGETVQLAPEPMEAEEKYKLWEALGHKVRLAQAYRARVLRVRLPGQADTLPVVTSRFGLSDRNQPDPVT